MRITDNCNVPGRASCPYLRGPRFHPGYTGKSGPDTWVRCSWHCKYVREIKKCDLAGNTDLQMRTFLEEKR